MLAIPPLPQSGRQLPKGKVVPMQPSASKRPVVLIVEDEPLVRMDAIEAIEAAGFDVIDATDADKAIAILDQRSDVRLIFTDIHMPASSQARPFREGPLAADQNYCDFRSCHNSGERLAGR
jgi:PleD family two-component response regulator